MLMKDGVESNRHMVFHNPGRVTEEIEFIRGEIREYIPSFEAAKEKFRDLSEPLHIFYLDEGKESHDKVIGILKKNKIRFDEQKEPFPI